MALNMKRTRRPLFERLQTGLEEGIAHARGELTLRNTKLPEPPPEIDGQVLATLRAKAGMSQAVLARVLNVSTKTLQSWEQGVRKPADASRRLLQIFREDPEAVLRAAGLSPTPAGLAIRKPAAEARTRTKASSRSGATS